MAIILDGVEWRKSRRSGHNGNCVEVGKVQDPAHIGLRDSKNRHGAALVITPQVWVTFVRDVKRGLHDI